MKGILPLRATNEKYNRKIRHQPKNSETNKRCESIAHVVFFFANVDISFNVIHLLQIIRTIKYTGLLCACLLISVRSS